MLDEITPVSLSYPKKEILVIRDDKLVFGFGTKLRKLFGFLSYFKEKKITNVSLYGSLHGNYLASFCYALYRSGIQVEANAFSKDLKLMSANRIIIKNHCQNLNLFRSREAAIKCHISQDESVFAFPEFGFHPLALVGLEELWQALLEKIKPPFTLFLEIGSGLTFFSALHAFTNTNITICGILVAEKKETFKNEWDAKFKALSLDPKVKANFHILEPKTQFKFGKWEKNSLLSIKEIFLETNILIEPIYGLKTWEFFLSPQDLPKGLPEIWVYLHQGGQLNHLDSILERV